MPKFLIISKQGYLTTAVKLKDQDYRRADNDEIKIVLMGEMPEQYCKGVWTRINRYKGLK
jgi:hypothetical protein